ncbi:MAG: DUF167 domain-containing protein [Patescibacteria group bacterium]|jgi:hypothetical protein
MLEEFKKTLEKKGEVYMRVKVRPNAGRTAVKEVMSGEEGKTVKIDIAAPPEKGKANAELFKFFEQEFHASKGGVKIISGKAEKIKLIKITAKTK